MLGSVGFRFFIVLSIKLDQITTNFEMSSMSCIKFLITPRKKTNFNFDLSFHFCDCETRNFTCNDELIKVALKKSSKPM